MALKVFRLLFSSLGFVLVVAGVAAFSAPAALIVAGVMLFVEAERG